MGNSVSDGLPFSLVLAGFDVFYSLGSFGSFNSLSGPLLKSLFLLELMLAFELTFGLELLLGLEVMFWLFFTLGDVNMLFATVLLRAVL